MTRLVPATATAAVLSLVVAACSGAPEVADPREIITQGIEATSEVDAFHFELGLDGTVSMPELGGGEMGLDGTSLQGDVDTEGPAMHVTFAVPFLLGMTGEAILLGQDMYVKTSMTGPLWTHVEATEADPVPDVTDPDVALGAIADFLDKEGVEVEKLDDVDCGDGSCYHVRLTIPASELASAGEDLGDVVPEDVFGEGLVLDLLFDKQDSYLVEVSTELAAESVGSVTLTLTLSDFGQDVTVEPPPSDEVTEDGDFPF